jgi:hypothetical protein
MEIYPSTHGSGINHSFFLAGTESIILETVTLVFWSEEPVSNVSVQDSNHSTLTKHGFCSSTAWKMRFPRDQNFNLANSNNH